MSEPYNNYRICLDIIAKDRERAVEIVEKILNTYTRLGIIDHMIEEMD